MKRFALDGNAELAASYEKTGIEFFHVDLDRGELPSVLEGCDVAVCSDVFEHLVYPQHSLQGIARCLGPKGILFSHVPNEFRLLPVLRIMLGLRDSVLFHQGRGCTEWDNPHLRRFTDRGYRAFLENRFRFNLRLNPGVTVSPHVFFTHCACRYPIFCKVAPPMPAPTTQPSLPSLSRSRGYSTSKHS